MAPLSQAVTRSTKRSSSTSAKKASKTKRKTKPAIQPAPRSNMAENDTLVHAAASRSTKQKTEGALNRFGSWSLGRLNPQVLAALIAADEWTDSAADGETVVREALARDTDETGHVTSTTTTP
jgi:hypothetical protein